MKAIQLLLQKKKKSHLYDNPGYIADHTKPDLRLSCKWCPRGLGMDRVHCSDMHHVQNVSICLIEGLGGTTYTVPASRDAPTLLICHVNPHQLSIQVELGDGIYGSLVPRSICGTFLTGRDRVVTQ